MDEMGFGEGWRLQSLFLFLAVFASFFLTFWTLLSFFFDVNDNLPRSTLCLLVTTTHLEPECPAWES
jgi:hypothetical protein